MAIHDEQPDRFDSRASDPAITEESGPRPIPASPVRLERGTEIAGKYAIRGILGTGGWAVVYDAEHLELGSRVAIKVLHRDDSTPESVVKRFRREARLSAAVRHPNVLEVYDVGALDDGSPYLVMEKLEGENLSERIHRSALEIGEVIDIAEQLAGALSALEVNEIVHRDVKPHNIMLHRGACGETVVKLVDFGISKSRHTPVPSRSVTEHGVLIGTPHYMSPEQIRNEELDIRSDIYSAGVVLFESLTGCTPFDAPVASALIAAILRDPLPNLRALRPDCPEGLEQIVRKALARNVEDRFQSSTEFAMALAQLDEAAVGGSEGLSRLDPTDSGRRSQPFARKGPRLAARNVHEAPTSAAELVPGAISRRTRRAERFRFGAAVFGFMALLGGSLVGLSNRGPSSTDDAELSNAVLVTDPEVAPAALPARMSIEEPIETPREPEAKETLEEARRSTSPRPSGKTAKRAPLPSESSGENASLLSERALGAFVRGQLPAARTLYRRAVESDPAYRDAWRGLGLVASQMGRTSEAKRAFQQYLTLSPSANDAREIRARLNALSDAR